MGLTETRVLSGSLCIRGQELTSACLRIFVATANLSGLAWQMGAGASELSQQEVISYFQKEANRNQVNGI